MLSQIDVAILYQNHTKRDVRIKYGNDFIVSLTEIFLESDHTKYIIKNVDLYENINILKYYIKHFEEVNISNFIESELYSWILQKQYNEQEFYINSCSEGNVYHCKYNQNDDKVNLSIVQSNELVTSECTFSSFDFGINKTEVSDSAKLSLKDNFLLKQEDTMKESTVNQTIASIEQNIYINYNHNTHSNKIDDFEYKDNNIKISSENISCNKINTYDSDKIINNDISNVKINNNDIDNNETSSMDLLHNKINDNALNNNQDNKKNLIKLHIKSNNSQITLLAESINKIDDLKNMSYNEEISIEKQDLIYSKEFYTNKKEIICKDDEMQKNFYHNFKTKAKRICMANNCSNFKEIKIENYNLLYEFLILVINNFYSQINTSSLIKFLPKDYSSHILLNEYTFSGLIANTNFDDHRFFTYEINKINEIKLIKNKIKDEDCCKNILKYIKTQEIINTTILLLAIYINNSYYWQLSVRNIDFNKIVKFCTKDEIYQFNNVEFKKQLLEHVLDFSFDLELMMVTIQKDTFIQYRRFCNFKKTIFRINEIYLMYFFRKLKLTVDKINLIHDVKEIIYHKIYDLELLNFLLKNDLDFKLFTDFEILNLLYKNEESKILLVKKYLKFLYEFNICVDDEKYKDTILIYKYLKHEKVKDKFPLITNFQHFTDNEMTRIIDNYFIHYDINEFVDILINTNYINNNCKSYLLSNYEKINKPLSLLLIIDKYDIHHNCDLLIEKLSEKDRQYFVKNITNYSKFLYNFLRPDRFSLTINRSVVKKLYHSIEDPLRIIKQFKNPINNIFVSTFLNEIFTSNYEHLGICNAINDILISSDMPIDILLSIANFYINKVLENEFFQEQQLFCVRDFINYLYHYMSINKRDFKLLQKCEEILSKLIFYSTFFDTDAILKNLKPTK
ncbi:hypothetical protein COBT_000210 [Conglomerata obtusa]